MKQILRRRNMSFWRSQHANELRNNGEIASANLNCSSDFYQKILNRAFEAGYKPTTARTLVEIIMSWNNMNPTQPLPDSFNISTLANQLEKSNKKMNTGDNLLYLQKRNQKIYSKNPKTTEQNFM